MTRPITTHRVLATVLAGLLGLGAAACTDSQRAEQKGQDVGEPLCDLRDADDQAEADEAVADIEEGLDELGSDYVVFTAEDRDDIRENLSDLVEHVVAGDDVLVQQDLAVIRANLDDISGDVDDASRSAASGVIQGLDDCV